MPQAGQGACGPGSEFGSPGLLETVPVPRTHAWSLQRNEYTPGWSKVTLKVSPRGWGSTLPGSESHWVAFGSSPDTECSVSGPIQSHVTDSPRSISASRSRARALANKLCIISLVWIVPRCAKDPQLDKKDMYRTNYEATKLALKRALNDEPGVEKLIANRHKIKHDMDDWS